MNDFLKQYEEEQMELFEKQLDRGEYEEEYMKSKDHLDGKVQQMMREVEAEERRRNWWTAGKVAAACVAAVLVTAVSIPDIRAVATDFLHSTMGLQIAGVKDDKKEAVNGNQTQKEEGFSFEWLMKFTEKEYWEWAKTHELTGGEFPSYVPEGFQVVENNPDAYEYLYVENLDMPWSDKKIDPKDDSTYGHFGTLTFPSVPSKAQRKKEMGEESALYRVTRFWEKGQRELWYSRELYDTFEMKEHDGVKEEAAKKLTVGGDQAYLVQGNDGTWLYIFGDKTFTRLYANVGIKSGEKLLVKMAESIQK